MATTRTFASFTVLIALAAMVLVAVLPHPAVNLPSIQLGAQAASTNITLGKPIPLSPEHNPAHSPATSREANLQVQNAIRTFNGGNFDPKKVVCALLYMDGEARRAIVWIYKYTSKKGQVFGDLQWFDTEGWKDAYPNKFFDRLGNSPTDLPQAVIRIVGCDQLPPLPPLATIP